MFNGTMTVEKIVMDAYADELYRWDKKVRYVESVMSQIVNKIYDIENGHNLGIFKRLKKKFSKDKNETVDRLNKMLARLEAKRDALEKIKPDEIAYHLGAIQNTLFYINIGGLKGGI